MDLKDDSPDLPNLYVARRNLRRNRLKSTLAVLSVLIGVLAIVALGIFGTALEASASNAFDDIGDEIVVTPAEGGEYTELREDEVNRISRVIGTAEAHPVKTGSRLVTGTNEQSRTTIYGMESLDGIYTASDGTIPPKLRDGAVVGSEVADKFDLGPGSIIHVGDEQYRVRAVLESKGEFSPISPNNIVIIPESDFETDAYSRIIIVPNEDQQSHEIATAIEDEMNLREDRVSVVQLEVLSEAVNELFTTIQEFLLAVGFISLLVAGVSILNTVLMSTTQRREEIGVLRAVGVGRADVLKILLLEAALLGLIGSVLGVALAMTAGVVVNWWLLQEPLAAFSLGNLEYVAFGLAIGVSICVLSALYPAWNAANDRPAEAIRDG